MNSRDVFQSSIVSCVSCVSFYDEQVLKKLGVLHLKMMDRTGQLWIRVNELIAVAKGLQNVLLANRGGCSHSSRFLLSFP
jgi:hypothetical protein